MFILNEGNISQIKAAVKAHGEIWFHGDGNIYHKKEESDHRQKYSNNRDGVQTYRVKFDGSSKIPTSVEDLTKALLDSKTRETMEATKPAAAKAVSTFSVDDDTKDGKEDAGNKKGGKKDDDTKDGK